VRFLANENFPAQSIRELRGEGYTVISVCEEMPGARDISILERACLENLIILTFDKDYGELIYRYRSFIPGGIVFFRSNPSTPEEPFSILKRMFSDEGISLQNAYTIIGKNRIRQRKLRKETSRYRHPAIDR
jgi:predicted nuclease of predicted toxin-antitoxin system